MLIFERRERETDRQSTRGGGPERQKDTEFEAGSRLSCQPRGPTRGSNHEPCDHDLSRGWTLNSLRHPRCPYIFLYIRCYWWVFFFLRLQRNICQISSSELRLKFIINIIVSVNSIRTL